MLVKQNEQERVAALQKLHQSLKPAVLLDGDNEKSTPDTLAKIEANSNLIKGYLQKNFTDERGVTDFTFENLRAAVLALVDDLHWTVPPKNFGAKERVSKRNAANALGLGSHKTEFDRPELNKPKPSIKELIKREAEDDRRNKTLAEVESIIVGHQGRTHARTQAERNSLRAQRDRLIQTGADPEVIKAAIEKSAREIRPSAFGS
jgi:hypothetical protein